MFICKNLNITKKTAQNIIERLLENKYIYKFTTGYNDVCYAIYPNTSNDVVEITPSEEKITPSDRVVENTTDVVDFTTNVVEITTPSKIKENKNKTNIIIPSREEVVEYCKAKNITEDIVDSFMYYYGERDWCRFDKNLKKNIPLKNWQLAVVNWAKNDKRYNEERRISLASKAAYAKKVEMDIKPKETAQQRDDRNLKELERIGNQILEEWNNDNTRDNSISETNKNALTDNSNS